MKLIGLVAFACAILLIQRVTSDVYFHNPRGSNNRLDGQNKNRRNNNRVFDSQNNAKGGYNVGEDNERRKSPVEQFHMEYFMGGSKTHDATTEDGKSLLNLEWTNQHGCGDDDLNCNIVLQYMCQPESEPDDSKDKIRNGENTQTQNYQRVNLASKSSKDQRKNGDVQNNRAINEPWEWYDKCNKRMRNSGLFTADQRLRGDTSKYTRQNRNGKQSGYECPEERDYYPYFHPTDWKDIGVLANEQADCDNYEANSFNVKPKGECVQKYPESTNYKHYSLHNNKGACENAGGKWVEFSNFLEKAPKYTTKSSCLAASTRAAPLIWAIPYRSADIDKLPSNGNWDECLVKLPPPTCKLAPHSRSNHLGNGEGTTPLTFAWHIPYFPSKQTQRCVLRIRYNISTDDPESKIVNDPVVKLVDDKLPLQLAINTAQFGRTFEDRSHVFLLKSREGTGIADDATVANVNVRGKRGNIVQNYPAVEYDFVPKRMEVSEDTCVHVHWTGSNSNRNNAAGEGRRGTDRSNFVQMNNASYSFPLWQNEYNDLLGDAEIVWVSDSATKTNADLVNAMASAGFYQASPVSRPDGKELQNQLDNATPSYRGAVFKMKEGKYFYMCTRNNNFTNRSQKGRIVVSK